MTSSYELRDDPDFDFWPRAGWQTCFVRRAPASGPPMSLIVVYGPGASLVPHDILWYADLPKRYAESAVTTGNGLNLGQPIRAGPGTTKRLFFIDWPLLDRHRDDIADGSDWWIDMQDPTAPALLDGKTLRATLADLGRGLFVPDQPSTPRPGAAIGRSNTSATTGGELNTALGYELIAPEAGVLIGPGTGRRWSCRSSWSWPPIPPRCSVLPCSRCSARRSPSASTTSTRSAGATSRCTATRNQIICARYLDGPTPSMNRITSWSAGKRRRVFLGLRTDADVDKFRTEADAPTRAAGDSKYPTTCRRSPATAHQLFLIPGGTPHGSGEGNVVLEISATPYLYSLRFYDWLRQKVDGALRPVHVGHAFRNLNVDRRGSAVEHDLVPQPRTVRQGDGWHEELLGSLPEMFFEVRRLVLPPGAVAGDKTVRTVPCTERRGGRRRAWWLRPTALTHSLVYAETLVVPAAVGQYSMRSLGPGTVRVVKALVR